MSRKRTIAESTSKDDSVALEDTDVPKVVENSHITREVLQRVPIGADGKYLKIISWNVNGLRALVTTKKSVLLSLIENHNPDILCLQETKIQDNTISDYDSLLDGYESYWNCSTVKKGYSGTAIFLKKSTIGIASGISRSGSVPIASTSTDSNMKAPPKKQPKLSAMWKTAKPTAATVEEETTIPTSTESSGETEEKAKPSQLASMLKVSYDFEDSGKKCFAGEGRTITVELDSFFLVACYVPNSGEGLVRLQYRVKEWEPHMRQYLKQLSARKPVVYTGDLNCGHLDLDIHNPTAKHIAKQAGLTAEERAAFSTMLAETDFRDAFRHFHPDAKGQFTYWSVRAFNRPGNKGIRLDYFICSPDLFPDEGSSSKESHLRVHDTYILPTDTVGCSDHCPVALVLEY